VDAITVAAERKTTMALKPKKTFLDKKNEDYKKDWSKKNPNMKRNQSLTARVKNSKGKMRGGK
jgi:hypothetical protein